MSQPIITCPYCGYKDNDFIKYMRERLQQKTSAPIHKCNNCNNDFIFMFKIYHDEPWIEITTERITDG